MWDSKGHWIRNWRAEELEKKIARAMHLRQLAKGNKKKLSRSEERTILAAAQQGV